MLTKFYTFYDLGNENTILVLGESGTGKSTLCNVLIGESHNAENFPSSPVEEGRTHHTKIVIASYRGNKDRRFRIIDTQGFDDPGDHSNPNTIKNGQIITELMKKLTEVSDVHLFLICLKGTTSRLHASLTYMITIFKEIFGHRMKGEQPIEDPSVFWRRCVIVFTHVPMGRTSIKRRLRAQNNMTDDQIAQNHMQKLVQRFKIVNTNFEYLFIDALHEENVDETTKFNASIEKLYDLLVRSSPAMTKAMNIARNKLERGIY